MPCPKCHADRLLTFERIVCPNCEKVKIEDTGSQIRLRQEALVKAIGELETRLAHIDLKIAFEFALEKREEMAEKIVKDPWTYGREILTWLASGFLLKNLGTVVRKEKKTSEDMSTFLGLSAHIIKLQDEISKLEQKQAIVIRTDDGGKFCLTESFPLSFIPRSVETEIKKALGLDPNEHLMFDQWMDGSREENVETILTQVLAMSPVIEIVKSEVISRKLKFSFNTRLLPSLTSKTARKFIEITDRLGQDLLLHRLNNMDKKGVVKLSKAGLYSDSLKQFSPSDVDWYLGLMRNFIIYDSANDSFYVPSFTLRLLRLAVFRWCGLPQVGKGLNYVGRIVEEWIFSLVQSFEAKTCHPLTGKPLLRVLDPATKEEIADVMIYDDKWIVVIESKFWECPLLGDMENELAKFEKKVDYVKNNLERLGFSKANTIPIFYTPFPPFATWHGIQLVPSKFHLGFYLHKFFKPKRPKLVEENQRLEQLVVSQDYPFPYPVDANELDEEIPPNTCRIQDARVIEYDKDEIDIEVLNPLGVTFTITLEINEKTHKDLTKQGITPGTLIRCSILNLSGSWSISQMLHFQKIAEQNSERKIMEIWGNTNVAREIIDVFKKHNLDITKFMEFCKRRTSVPEYWTRFLAARMGSVLFIDATYDVMAQCECGQIVGLSNDIVEQMKKRGGGKILCMSCLMRTAARAPSKDS